MPSLTRRHFFYRAIIGFVLGHLRGQCPLSIIPAASPGIILRSTLGRLPIRAIISYNNTIQRFFMSRVVMNSAGDSRAEILKRINHVVCDILGSSVAALNEETTARDVSGWDSLSHVQILLGVEEAFGIRLNTTEIALMENAGSLIDLVQKHVSADAERV